MSAQTPDSRDRFHLVGHRNDGTRTVVFSGMTREEASRALAAVEQAGIFEKVAIEIDETEGTTGV